MYPKHKLHLDCMMKTNWSVFRRRLKTPPDDYTTIARNRVSDYEEESACYS